MNILLTSIVIIICVTIIALLVNHFERAINREKSKISIKESIDLIQVPIVTFYEGDTKLNFILDTGSSHSHISEQAAGLLIGTPVETDYSYVTCTGSDNVSKEIDSVLTYKNKTFKATLYINKGLDDSFANMKKENKVQVHGILGSDFLKKYKYILDFADLTAYHK